MRGEVAYLQECTCIDLVQGRQKQYKSNTYMPCSVSDMEKVPSNQRGSKHLKFAL